MHGLMTEDVRTRRSFDVNDDPTIHGHSTVDAAARAPDVGNRRAGPGRRSMSLSASRK